MAAALSHVAFIVKELERVDGMLKARNTRYRRDVSSFVPENNGGHIYVNCIERKKTLFNFLKNRLQKSTLARKRVKFDETSSDRWFFLKYCKIEINDCGGGMN